MMSKELQEVTEVAEHWSVALKQQVQEFVGLANNVKEVTSAKERKATVTTRTKLAKLIKGIDDARKKSNKETTDSNKAIAAELEEIIVPLKLEYDTAIDVYDKALEAEQQAKVAEAEREAAEAIAGRMEQLTGLITEQELEFTPIASMTDEQFEKFVAYRKTITIVPVEPKIPDPVTIEQEELEAEEESDKPFETIGDALDDHERQMEKEATEEPIATTAVTNLQELTDDEELGQFYKFKTRSNTIKKPAILKSETALAIREMMDALTEALEVAVPEEE